MNGEVEAIDCYTVTPRREGDVGDIVSGHLAARRRERRVVAILSVLVVCGLLLLGGVLLGDQPVVRLPSAIATPAGR
jgi:hypothetical protein